MKTEMNKPKELSDIVSSRRELVGERTLNVYIPLGRTCYRPKDFRHTKELQYIQRRNMKRIK